MVRVISVHHFTTQDVTTTEQVTASTTAPPDRLLLALLSHCIEVRDLNLNGDILFSFPTVDKVLQLYHCLNGDYVATLETKYDKQNHDLKFVRVYVNWNSVATLQQSKMDGFGASLALTECGMVQPMRARIAGRVTPSTNYTSGKLASLEMIEIPTKSNPDSLALCQITGNILIQSNCILIVYSFKVITHDISKLKFIDFHEMDFHFELAFKPESLCFVENYVACSNSEILHLFKVTNTTTGQTANNDSIASNVKFSEDETVDFETIAAKETVHLNSVLQENSSVHKYSPFIFTDADLKAKLRLNGENQKHLNNLTLVNLIQLRLKPIDIDRRKMQIREEFKSILMQPIYVKSQQETKQQHQKKHVLRSQQHSLNLNSVICLVATQQEGYLFQFNDKEVSLAVDNCTTVYPFTAPVFKLLLEDYFLHAITEAGLETYTLRTMHRAAQFIDSNATAIPPLSQPVCLVGLRPFLNIEQALLSQNYLVLLANSLGDIESLTSGSDTSSNSSSASCTCYSLQLPKIATVFDDFMQVANVHRFTSAQTYLDLLNEAHMIAKMDELVVKFGVGDDGESVKTIRVMEKESGGDVYARSCCLLGDYFILFPDEEHHHLAVQYYKMAAIECDQVIRRVRKLQPEQLQQNYRGLIFYLKTILLSNHSQNTFRNGGTNFVAKQKFAETILDLFETYDYESLPLLILKVPFLREFGTDNLIGTLTAKKCVENVNERHLALVILHVLRGNHGAALKSLAEIENAHLERILSDNYDLLFDMQGSARRIDSFSEFCNLLMLYNTQLASELLFQTLKKKQVTLGKLLKVFLDFLSSSCDSNTGSQVLQYFLELYFHQYFIEHSSNCANFDRSSHEAIKLLVRSYLSQLQLLHQSIGDKKARKESSKSSNYLFCSSRYEYFNQMPPFQSLVLPGSEDKVKFDKNEDADLILKKLQALLSSKVVPNQVLLEVNTFLSLNENLRGKLSLQICILNVNDAVSQLIEACPQCLLQYAKDVFTKADEWKYLIACIQHKVLSLSYSKEQGNAFYYYKKLLKDVLTFTATSMTLEHLLNVFPQHMNYSQSYCDTNVNQNGGFGDEEETDILKDIQDYDSYIVMCKETMHANQIKKLIVATGQQLLCTLNL